MIRLVAFLIVVLVIATGLAWLADRPGSLVVNWQGYEIETSVFRAAVILSLIVAGLMMAWNLLRQIWLSPALLGRYMTRQRQKRGLDALTSGMIAVGAGDRSSATRYAALARKSLPNEPMTQLLRAQTAQLTGDRAGAKRIYEAMLSAPDTEPLGLRGLYLEAIRMKEPEAARHFAERAMSANPTLSWPAEALFQLQCQDGDWAEALESLKALRRFGHVDKKTADRRRAVLLTAQAEAFEDSKPDQAVALALEAHGLAPDLIPAAAIAGRLLASRGNTGKAAKVVQRTWSQSPHPDLAVAYAYARIGDSPTDRLDRVKRLAALAPKGPEGPVAVAVSAIEARRYDDARHALAPLLDDQLTQRVATLMARIEGEQYGDKGKVREWLARAITAGRDPAWTADGVVSESWAPVSPVSGEIDAFEWRVPVDQAPARGTLALSGKAAELAAILASAQPALDAVSDKTDRDGGSAKTVSVDAQPMRRSDGEPNLGDATAPDSAVSGQTNSSAAAEKDSVVSKPKPDLDKRSHDLRPSDDIDPDGDRDGDDGFGGDADDRRKNDGPAVSSGAERHKTEASVRIRRSEPEARAGTQPGAQAGKGKKTKILKSKGYAASKRDENDVFISPRAPDDPGPDASEIDDPQSGLKPFRGTS